MRFQDAHAADAAAPAGGMRRELRLAAAAALAYGIGASAIMLSRLRWPEAGAPAPGTADAVVFMVRQWTGLVLQALRLVAWCAVLVAGWPPRTGRMRLAWPVAFGLLVASFVAEMDYRGTAFFAVRAAGAAPGVGEALAAVEAGALGALFVTGALASLAFVPLAGGGRWGLPLQALLLVNAVRLLLRAEPALVPMAPAAGIAVYVGANVLLHAALAAWLVERGDAARAPAPGGLP